MVAERPDRKGWNKGIRLEMDRMDKKNKKRIIWNKELLLPNNRKGKTEKKNIDTDSLERKVCIRKIVLKEFVSDVFVKLSRVC